MTSVDELFRKPNLPSGNLKRKLEVPDAEQAYKATKLSATSTANGHTNGASVDDAPEDDENEDLEAGPELPPDDAGEDGDRFFGGGVTKSSAEALDYIDQQDGDDYAEEKIDSSWLRRLAVSFEKKVSKNAEQRARYEGDPQKFMASEADLDTEIKSWSLLAEHPELFADFAESESVAMLVGLLAHENTDIAIAAIEILSELLDEDVEAEAEQWDQLVAALLEADLLGLLMSNLSRLDERNESDRNGVYHSLAVLESLGGQQAVAEKIGKEKVLTWLCKRLEKPEKTTGQNKQYAAEVLQVLLQTSPLVRKRLARDVDGVDLILQLLAAYRKRDPVKDSTEEEYTENLFDALACVVDEAEGKSKFVDAEGVELALIMLKEGSFSKLRALRLLDHACGGRSGQAVCEKLVEAAGLKTIFGMYAKKPDSTTTEHILGILASLLRLLPGESAARIRTLAKFTEKNYEKVKKLIGLREDYARRVGAVDSEIRAELAFSSGDGVLDREDEYLSRRLDAGLYVLQTVDVILAWLVAEDAEVKNIVNAGGHLDAIRASLQEQLNGLDSPDGEGDADTTEMLGTLIEFMK
ncbi:hypothetical protein LTR91_023351 [Friedmanniomyces endolithicus]|uniref:Beta-catenin-like protein 1 N-terminal domain-containing protein n=1 Tax=Friedmanniomyces endolithicus TaxID=329885 RepID=A0AAN6JYF6_9PEZI|nr:hypothetical protein LTR75_010203 [Friedmanniomyces endolithicus]KAK0845376.1 hypothetical protein LTS02_015323 [Friedmanniomyces endolithicus]KAK0845722.1 hypothetical protein LTR03_007291 [Friedmanniomyces endolithicus]KAK0876343.1 hypothetical protein LTR87_009835 [Friedmanniomyces endolithicus]KAK0910220.1 hypothetical protein LTR02_004029 [Friedmanniomyces endolithicus]